MYIGNKAYIKNVFRLAYEQADALLSSGKTVDVSVSEHKTKRSSAQNRFYFKVNEELARFFNNAGLTYGDFNLPYTTELCHEINKKIFGISTTTRMSKEDFCDYMTKILSYWIEKTNGQFEFEETPYSYLERTGLANAE